MIGVEVVAVVGDDPVESSRHSTVRSSTPPPSGDQPVPPDPALRRQVDEVLGVVDQGHRVEVGPSRSTRPPASTNRSSGEPGTVVVVPRNVAR